MFTLAELENVIPLVRASVPPTPQYAWPLLKAHTGVAIVIRAAIMASRWPSQGRAPALR
jgi:hypothetical protein